MAPGACHGALGISYFSHSLETTALKLSAEHFPISCSLLARLEEAIATTPGTRAEDVMPLEELLKYLRKPQDLDLTPYADLLNRMEAMGDPAQPTAEQAVILRWLGEAMHYYEKRFPIEEPLASTVRRLKPLTAAIALTDPDFLQPDVHPLHQLLDCIQERAVGWQARLGRVGANLEKQILAAVEEALEWFDNPDTDLAGICADFLDASERDKERANRMCSRVIDTERGRAKNAAAKLEAANMLNEALEKFPAPLQIGAFIKGAWYDSAQLVLLKFGSSSEQWLAMCKATETLLASVQNIEKATAEKREEIVSLLRTLPKELRQWLLSLHHDTSAVNEAMATIESVHLRLLRKQPLEITWIPAIQTPVLPHTAESTKLLKTLKPVVEWHWFEIETFSDGVLRVQLVLKSEESQSLVFANMAGMKTAVYSFAEFDDLMRNKRITALPHGGGFSLCLALAAGLDTVEKLDALYTSIADKALAARAAEEAAAAPPIPEEIPKEASPAEEQEEETEPEESLDDVLERFARGEYEDAEDTAAETEAEAEDVAIAEESEFDNFEGIFDDEPFEDIASEEDAIFDSEDIIGDTASEESENESTKRQAPASDIDLSDAFKARDAVDAESYLDSSDAFATNDDLLSGEELEGLESLIDDTDTDDSYFGSAPAPHARDAKTDYFGGAAENADAGAPVQEAPALSIASSSGLNLEIGSWLSFHDGGAPVLAQLETHEADGDIFHFVNEEGQKFLVMPGDDLKTMLEQELVDIVEPGP